MNLVFQVIKEDEFLDLRQEQLVPLLQSENLHIENEFQVNITGASLYITGHCHYLEQK